MGGSRCLHSFLLIGETAGCSQSKNNGGDCNEDADGSHQHCDSRPNLKFGDGYHIGHGARHGFELSTPPGAPLVAAHRAE
jgi:hypothetical protein